MITLPRCGNGWKSTVNVAFGQEFEGGKTNQNEDPGDKTCSFFEPFLTTLCCLFHLLPPCGPFVDVLYT